MKKASSKKPKRAPTGAEALNFVRQLVRALMSTVAVANQKGGVGKTTTCRGIAFSALEVEIPTLCVDLDPQANFSKTMLNRRATYLGADSITKDALEHAGDLTASMLFSETPIDLQPLDCGGGAYLIRATRELLDVAAMPLEAIHRPRAALAKLAADYGLCVIDTPPTLGNPLYAALIAADFVVCPLTMDQDAIDGVGDLLEDIERVKQMGWNSNLVNLGLLANKVNTRRVFDMQALQQLKDELGDTMMEHVLYDRAATQYAKNQPVWRVASGESQKLAAKEMKAVCGHILHCALN